jgi:hypothetical protein
MPKQTINYENTIIYKLVCKDLNVKDLYVGHTTNFTKRKSNHKSDCNNPQNKNYDVPVYQFIRENGGWENWDMIEIEKYTCEDKNEATARERYWYEELKATLNACVPARTKQEYYEKHKEDREQKRKKQYETDKSFLLEKVECPCGSCIVRNCLSRHKKSLKHQDWEKEQSK